MDNNQNNNFGNNMPNMNSQQPMNNSNMNGQPMGNPNMNNLQPMNNNMPNQGGMVSTMGGQTNQSPQKNSKLLMIGGIVLGVIILFVIFGGGGSGHKNTTGMSEYKASDVDYNCYYVDGNTTYYSDLLFNYDGYELVTYGKIIFKGSITDANYKTFVEEINYAYCYGGGDCTASELDLGITKLGFDTKIHRYSDRVEVTYRELHGSGYTAAKSDMEAYVDSIKAQGFTCS